MSGTRSPHVLFFAVAAWLEQVVRAYPRLHRAFYATITRSARVRDLVGRAKDGVRTSGGRAMEMPLPAEEPEILARRFPAVAARLGLLQPPSP